MSKKNSAPKQTVAASKPVSAEFDHIALSLISWSFDRDIGKQTPGEESFAVLVESVKAHGIETPIIVKADKDGGYKVVAGRRRCEAAKELKLETVPARILPADWSGNVKGAAFRENTVRKPLTAVEKIRAVRALKGQGFGTAKKLAEETGMSESSCENLLRCANKLSDKVLALEPTLKKAIEAAAFDTEDEQIACVKGELKKGGNGAAAGAGGAGDGATGDAGAPDVKEIMLARAKSIEARLAGYPTLQHHLRMSVAGGLASLLDFADAVAELVGDKAPRTVPAPAPTSEAALDDEATVLGGDLEEEVCAANLAPRPHPCGKGGGFFCPTREVAMSNASVGRFRAKAVSCTTGSSPMKGTPYISVWLMILAGPHKDAMVEWVGFWSPKTMEQTARSLAAMGFTGEDPGELHELEDCSQALPSVVDIQTQTDADGIVSVRWINPVRSASASSFQNFSGELMKARAEVGEKRAVKQNGKPSEDDMPFLDVSRNPYGKGS